MRSCAANQVISMLSVYGTEVAGEALSDWWYSNKPRVCANSPSDWDARHVDEDTWCRHFERSCCEAGNPTNGQRCQPSAVCWCKRWHRKTPRIRMVHRACRRCLLRGAILSVDGDRDRSELASVRIGLGRSAWIKIFGSQQKFLCGIAALLPGHGSRSNRRSPTWGFLRGRPSTKPCAGDRSQVIASVDACGSASQRSISGSRKIGPFLSGVVSECLSTPVCPGRRNQMGVRKYKSHEPLAKLLKREDFPFEIGRRKERSLIGFDILISPQSQNPNPSRSAQWDYRNFGSAFKEICFLSCKRTSAL